MASMSAVPLDISLQFPDQMLQRTMAGAGLRFAGIVHLTMHSPTVFASIVLIRPFSITSPIMITVKSPAKYIGCIEAIFVFENEPSESAGARRNAKHKLGCNQCAPRERSTNLQTGQYTWKCCRHEDLHNKAKATKPVVSPYHFERTAY